MVEGTTWGGKEKGEERIARGQAEAKKLAADLATSDCVNRSAVLAGVNWRGTSPKEVAALIEEAASHPR